MFFDYYMLLYYMSLFLQSSRLAVLAWATVREYRRLDGSNNRNYFLIVMEAGSLSTQCWHGWVLVRTLPGLPKVTFLLWPHMEGVGPGGLLSCLPSTPPIFYTKSSSPIRRVLLSGPHSYLIVSQRPYSQIPSHCGLGTST